MCEVDSSNKWYTESLTPDEPRKWLLKRLYVGVSYQHKLSGKNVFNVAHIHTNICDFQIGLILFIYWFII